MTRKPKAKQFNSTTENFSYLFLMLFNLRVYSMYLYYCDMRKLDVENLLRVIMILIYRFIKYLSFAPIYLHSIKSHQRIEYISFNKNIYHTHESWIIINMNIHPLQPKSYFYFSIVAASNFVFPYLQKSVKFFRTHSIYMHFCYLSRNHYRI